MRPARFAFCPENGFIFLASLAIRQQQRTITFPSALEMLETFGLQVARFRPQNHPLSVGTQKSALSSAGPLFQRCGTRSVWKPRNWVPAVAVVRSPR